MIELNENKSFVLKNQCTNILEKTKDLFTFFFIVTDEYDKAKKYYENILNKVNDNLKWEENSRLQWQLGNICKEGLGDYEKALDHYLIALEILCQNLSPIDIKLRNLFLSIAHVLLLQANNQNHIAIDYFQRVLDIDSSKNSNNQINLVNDHYYLGLLYQNQEDFSQAVFHFEKSLKYFVSIQSKENINFHFLENNYLINENIYDKKAYETLSITSLPNLCELHFNLATAYQSLHQKQHALKHAQAALQLSTSDQTKFKTYQNYFKKF